jgi:NAD(P)-dependent dehydrogenase (short-subunit alcohol dehydrogenase family)
VNRDTGIWPTGGGFDGESDWRLVGYEDLTGSRVLILGGTGGIGSATASLAVRLNADVAVAVRRIGPLRQISRDLPTVSTYQCDAVNVEELTALLDRTSPEHIVVAIGEAYYHTLAEIDVEEAMTALRSRFAPPIAIGCWAQTPGRRLKSITIVGGIVLKRPVAGAALWAFVAPGLIGLVEALALEVAPVRVNTVSPGFVADSPMNPRLLGAEATAAQRRELEQTLPTRRCASVLDVARHILTIAADPAVTGTARVVDGGHAVIA